MTSKLSEIGWGFLTLLAAAAAWVCATGKVWVAGFPAGQVELFAARRGVLGPESVPPGLHLGLLSGDIFWWNSALLVGFTLSAFLLGMVALRRLWQNPLSPALALGTLFFGAGTCWVQSQTAEEGLLHLLQVLAVAAFMSGKVALLCALVPPLILLNPAVGVSLYLPLTFLALRRHAVYGPVVTAGAVVGVGALLVPMAGDYTLEPSLHRWTLWSVVPLVLSFWPREISQERKGFYLSLLLGSALTGTPELATAMALGDLALVLLKKTEKSTETEPFPEGAWTVTGRTLLQLAALVVFTFQILPGERYLNRGILIPAQKKRVPFSALFSPFHLGRHTALLGQQPWRQTTPFSELREHDLDALSGLPKGGSLCVLTEGQVAENRTLSLLYAILAERELVGWDDAENLCGPMLLCKRRGRNFLVNGPSILLRQAEGADLPKGPEQTPESAEVDFSALLEAPYHLQQVSRESGAGYLWVSQGQHYTLFFPDQPAEVILGSHPGKVKLLPLEEKKGSRELEVHPTNWVLRYVPSQEVLPSRSLVSLPMTLENQGAGAITSDSLEAVRLETDEPSFSSFKQPLLEQFILFPGESLSLDLVLATPEPEGTYALQAVALTPQGFELPLPIKGEPRVKTWRRLPPVGTWVEEP